VPVKTPLRYMGRARTPWAKRRVRHVRVRRQVSGTSERPRLAVFRSLRHIYAQVIDDGTGTTVAEANSRGMDITGNKIDQAFEVGRALAERAKEAGVGSVVFDRGSYRYHGRVKALADGARGGGLDF